jgi:hypothetical protein
MERSRSPVGRVIRKDYAPQGSPPYLAIVGAKDGRKTSPDHPGVERYGIGARTGIFRGLVLGLPITIVFWGAILWILFRIVG